MWEKKLEAIEKKFTELETALSQRGDATSDSYLQAAKEYKQLEPLIRQYRDLKKIRTEMGALSDPSFAGDETLSQIAAQEQKDLEVRAAELETSLQKLLVSEDPNANRNAFLEIRAGAGGDEAALFVGDLYRMYSRFAQSKNLDMKEMSSHPTGLGGYKEAIAFISGPNAYKLFKYEQGVHRVQRVPKTEASGRIHTSTVTVAVLPEATEVEIQIDPKEIKIDTYRSSGAGGQHVNKTESAVRITHLPTGLIVACQDERSQLQNRAKAFALLRARLKSNAEERAEKERRQMRKQQVGSGERSEKIRTYNFPQDRITDHRINQNFHDIKSILDGQMDEIVRALQALDNQ